MKANFLVLLCVLALTACASTGTAPTAERRFQKAEQMLNTDGSTTFEFHSVLYYPHQIRPQFDGYIIGVEKSGLNKITTPADLRMKGLPGTGLDTAEATRKKLTDLKAMFISHILKQSGATTCFEYNVYQALDGAAAQFADGCHNNAAEPQVPLDAVYAGSWTALDRLSHALATDLASKQYSHIVVLVMGWNTTQEEAVRNFNSIVFNLKAQDPTFRPLVIGVTWTSQWTYRWLDSVIRFASFPSKAQDADQLGLSWLGILLHETIPDAHPGPVPLIVIGHSFGSRAASTAACIGPGIYNMDPARPRQNIHALINLQGAFLSSRLFGADDQGIHFPDRCRNVKRQVLTASSFDTAVTQPFWGDYAGTSASYGGQCGSPSAAIDCRKAQPSGHYPPSSRHIIYLDADLLIRENAYGSGGGAHSDIYRREHGAMIWQAITEAVD